MMGLKVFVGFVVVLFILLITGCVLSVDPAMKHAANMMCMQRGGVEQLIPLKSKLVVVECRDTAVGVLGQKQKREADKARDNLEAIKF